MHEILLLDSNSKIPHEYREYTDKNIEIIKKAGISIVGLKNLGISGSGQFSEHGLQYIISRKNKEAPIYIVDLRLEPHGFLNGTAVSWYATNHNMDHAFKTIEELKNHEEHLLHDTLDKTVKLYLNKHAIDEPDKFQDFQGMHVKIALTEEQLVNNYGVRYKRFYVTDHSKPSTKSMQEFLKFYRQLPKNAQLHMHCRGGKGRSTTFMVMLDILSNAKQVSLEDIMERNAIIGGSNMTRAVFAVDKEWKKGLYQSKTEFLRKFYNYVHDNDIYIIDWQ